MAIPAEFQRAYPVYVIAGEKPVSLTETPDGGLDLLGWDFKLKKMTRAAGDYDAMQGVGPGPVLDNFEFSEGDVRRVTKREFNAAVKALSRGDSPT